MALVTFDEGGKPAFEVVGLFTIQFPDLFFEWYQARYNYNGMSGYRSKAVYYGTNERLYEGDLVITLACPPSMVISIIPVRFIKRA